MAGPVCTAAGEEDQVTGESLILLDQDDVPNLRADRQTVPSNEPCLCAARLSFCLMGQSILTDTIMVFVYQRIYGC